jgi:lipopolysaccharide/colanic/teichoic acid biosynthesis glycosyltransferase
MPSVTAAARIACPAAQQMSIHPVIAEYAFRHHMKPGITGWTQINGYRGETTRVEQMQRRVEHDLWYIDNWSLWLDFTTLVRTSFEVLGGRMAY